MCKPSAGDLYVLDSVESGVYRMVGDGGDELTVDGLPHGSREGDVFRLTDGVFVPCPEETEQRRARIRGKMDSIFGKKKRPD